MLVDITERRQMEQAARESEAGFDHHMVKPVDPAALMKLLAESGPG